MLFFRKKEIKHKSYDKSEWTPVLKKSICTGETVAGFCNNHTGKFRDEMLAILSDRNRIMQKKSLEQINTSWNEYLNHGFGESDEE